MRILGKIRTVYRLTGRVSTTINRNGKYSTLYLKPLWKNGVCTRFVSSSSDGKVTGVDKCKTNKFEKNEDLEKSNEPTDDKYDKIILKASSDGDTILPAALLNDTKSNHKILLIPIDLTHDHRIDYSYALHQTLKTLSLIQENFNAIQNFSDETSNGNQNYRKKLTTSKKDIPLIENSIENELNATSEVLEDDGELSALAEDGVLIDWDKEFGATESKYTPDDMHLTNNSKIENEIENNDTLADALITNNMSSLKEETIKDEEASWTNEVFEAEQFSSTLDKEYTQNTLVENYTVTQELDDTSDQITENEINRVMNEQIVINDKNVPRITLLDDYEPLLTKEETLKILPKEEILKAGKEIDSLAIELPEYLENQLNNLPISSMKLEFEMEMPNVRDLISSFEKTNIKYNSESLLNKSLRKPSINMSTDVVLSDNKDNSDNTVPMSFNALIKGTVQIHPEKMKSEKLAEMGTPELNDYITSVAANVCSVALQKGFDPNIGTALYETNPIAKSRSSNSPKVTMSSTELYLEQKFGKNASTENLSSKKGYKQSKGKNCKVCEDKIPKQYFTPDRNLQTNSCADSSLNASLNVKIGSLKGVKFFKIQPAYELNRSLSYSKADPPPSKSKKESDSKRQLAQIQKKKNVPTKCGEPEMPDPNTKCGHGQILHPSKCGYPKNLHSTAFCAYSKKGDSKCPPPKKSDSKSKCAPPKKAEPKTKCAPPKKAESKSKAEPKKTDSKSKCAPPKKAESKSKCAPPKKAESKSKCAPPKKAESKSKCAPPKKAESKSKCAPPKKAESKSKCAPPKKAESKPKCAPPKKAESKSKCAPPKKAESKSKCAPPKKAESKSKCAPPKKAESKSKCAPPKKAESKSKCAPPKKAESKSKCAPPKKAESKSKCAPPKKAESKSKCAPPKKAEPKKSDSKSKCAPPKKAESKSKCAPPKKAESKSKCAPPKKAESKSKCAPPKKAESKSKCAPPKKAESKSKCAPPKKAESKSKCAPPKKAESKSKCAPPKKAESKSKCAPPKKAESKSKCAPPKKAESKSKCAPPKKAESKSKCAPPKKAESKSKCAPPKKAEPKKSDSKSKCDDKGKRKFSTTVLYFKKDSKDVREIDVRKIDIGPGTWEPKDTCFNDDEDLICKKPEVEDECKKKKEKKYPCAERYVDELYPKKPKLACYDYFEEMEKCRPKAPKKKIIIPPKRCTPKPC